MAVPRPNKKPRTRSSSRPRHPAKASTVTLVLHPTFSSVLEIVLQQQILHWKDALTLGRFVCRETRTLWDKTNLEDVYFSPLLKELEGMIGGYPELTTDDDGNLQFGAHGDKILWTALPQEYPDLSILHKCQALTGLLERIVVNTRAKFDFENPSNRRVNREADPFYWITLIMGGGARDP